MAASGSFCPYVGLRPYAKEDQDYFFGRGKEQRIICSNVLTAPLTILYGASGCGKSSVLRAGVLPKLSEESGVIPVYFAQWQDVAFVENFKSACLTAAGLAPEAVSSSLSFDEFLLHIIEKTGKSLVILLDQFEEYLLYHDNGQNNSRFEPEFARAVNRSEVDANILIGIREDSISKLDRFRARISNLLSNTLRLDQLNAEAAAQAIRLPLDLYNQRFRQGMTPITIEDDLVERVIAEVRTGEVRFGESAGIGAAKTRAAAEPIETAFLQLVMTRLWEEEYSVGSAVLRLSTLEKLGGAQHIVETYLDRVLESFSDEERNICAQMFQYMVTPSRTKIAQSTSDLVSFAGQPAEKVKPILMKLDDARVLRRIDQLPERYEIFHDVLAAAVLDWRIRYTAAFEARQKEKEVNRQREFETARREARRFRRLMIAMGILLVVAASAAFIALKYAKWAVAEQAKADMEAKRAAANEADAKSARDLAEIQKGLAQKQSALATFQQSLAEKEAKNAVRLRHLTIAAQLAAASGDVAGRDSPLSALLALTALAENRAAGVKAGSEGQQALYRAVAAAANEARLRGGGHSKEVRWVAFSPDGKRVATASFDNTAKIWDSSSGRELLNLSGHTGVLLEVIFSPDGKRLATASGDQTAKIWDAQTGEPVLTLSGHKDFVWGVGFSPDGKQLATSSADGTVRIWDASTGSQIRSCCGNERGVFHVVFSPDGKFLATAGYDNEARLWDASTGAQVATFAGHTASVTDVAFSPDGKRVCTASDDKTARIWETVTGKPLVSLTGHTEQVSAAGFSPDGKQVVTSSYDRSVRIWDAGSGKPLLTLSGHSNNVLSVVFDGSGRVASGSLDNTAKIWDTKRGRELVTLSHVDPGTTAASFDAGVTRLATSDGQTAQTWDYATRRLLAIFAHNDRINDIALSADGRWLATVSTDETARIWDATTGERVSELRGHKGAVNGASFSPDGTLVATAGSDNTAKIWEAKSGKELKTLTGHTDWLNTVVFDPQGKRLATASVDETAKLWDVQHGTLLHTLTGGAGAVNWVTFSPDGSLLVTASAGGSAMVWDTASGKMVTRLVGHSSSVRGVFVSPDGQRIATLSDDRTVRIWDARSGQEQLSFTVDAVDIAFSRDGKRLSIYEEGGMIKDILLDFDQVEKYARTLAAKRTLTPEECHRYFGTSTCPARP